MQKMITFIGNIGAGKSTLADSAKSYYESKGISVLIAHE
jgi:thymidylate kinase